MKRSGEITIAVILLGLIASGCVISSLAGYSWKLDGNGLKIGNPVQEAQATRVAMEANDEAAAREVERKAAQAAAPALALRNVLAALGIGLGVMVSALVALVGSAFAAVAWLHKRATSVYADAKGLYPLVVSKGWGWVSVHDANKGLGPAAVYRVPTPVDHMLSILASVASFLRSGHAPGGMISPGPEGAFPLPGSEDTMERIAARSQAVQLMAGATHGAAHNERVSKRVARVATQLLDPNGLLGEPQRPALPPVTVISDPREIERFKQTFVLEARGSDWYE
ncbi:MAG: hypothetical protein JW850_03115 [Thermoflexales bacterium]|nr:hypothetical protein [Thermoflexales bacterium]